MRAGGAAGVRWGVAGARDGGWLEDWSAEGGDGLLDGLARERGREEDGAIADGGAAGEWPLGER